MTLSLEELTHVKVYSASRHLEDSREAPAAVTVVSADEITRYGWRTLADVLRSLRGFYTAYDRDYTYLGVRGFLRSGDYNSRILLLINGHRLNDNVYDSAQIGTEFPLDLDLIDHIEIVRGPSSSLFGTNAVFGVINVITRRPTAETLVETSGDASSYLGRSGRLTTSFQLHGLSALLSGSLFRNQGEAAITFPGLGAAENLDGDHYAHGFGDLQFGSWRIQGLFSQRDKTVPTAPYNTNFNEADSSEDVRGYVDAGYHRDLNPATELDTRFYYDSYQSYGSGFFGGRSPLTRFAGVTEGYADWVGVETNLGHNIGRHHVTVGGEYQYSLRVNQKNYILGGPTVESSRNNPWLAAFYGEAELKLASRLTLHAGGRFDYYDAFGATLSPRVALIADLARRTSLKYIYGRAFRAPNAYESYYADTVLVEPAPVQLKPEQIETHEVVFDQSLHSWLSFTVDGFWNRLTNLIDQLPDPSTGFTYFANVGRNSGRGVEVELEAKRASGLSGRASYTLADATDNLLHSRLANSPLSTAKLNATLPLWHVGFAGAELLYTGAQRSYQDTRVSPWFLANLTMSTRILWHGWQFSASGYNLFDRAWAAPAGLELRQAEVPQDGRTFRVKVTYAWHRERTPRP